MMKTPSLLYVSLLALLFAASSVVEGFAPAVASTRPARDFRKQASSASRTELSSAEDTTSSSSSVGSPFDEYSQNDPKQRLEYKDTVMGTGDVAEQGKVLTVGYKGRLMSNNAQFDEGESYSFRVGQGRVMPGWEKGVIGMRVGGQRTLRIPPSLAFGDRWVKGTIPPNSHVEFDLELKSIAQNPVEEALVQLNVGPGRAITAVVLVLILAISPMLS